MRANKVVFLLFLVGVLMLTCRDSSAQSGPGSSGLDGKYGSAGEVAVPAGEVPRIPTQSLGNIEVLTDTQGVDFGPYLSRVLRDVRSNWYARAPSAAAKNGKLEIELAIEKDGSVSGMKLAPSSGDASQDHAAWDGIAALSPFPPLPSEFKGNYLALRFRFYYYPDKSDSAEMNSFAAMLPISVAGAGQPAGAARPDPTPQVSTARAVTRVEAEIVGDTGGIDFAPYLESSVLPMLRANWYRFASKSSDPNSAGTKGGVTTVEFEILVDGNLGPDGVEGSGHGKLDELALKVIQKSAPFPALPSGSNGRGLNVRCHFYFNPDEDMKAGAQTAAVPGDGNQAPPPSGEPPPLPSVDARRNGKAQEEGAVLRSCNPDAASPSAGSCITAPQAIYSPVPAASAPEAGKTGPRGVVTLSLIVRADGKASGVEVVKSLDPDLDKRAMDAVSTWKFKPGMKDGVPVSVQILVEVKFDPH